ncbi:MAG: hypothetical protein QM817_02760 [Archangium sp.]
MESTFKLSHQVRRVITWMIMVPKRARFVWQHRTRLDLTEPLIATVRRLCSQARERGGGDLARIHNATLFVLLLDEDLHWLTSQMLAALDESERKFVARQFAVLLYEASEDLPQLFGRGYRDALRGLKLDARVLPQLDTITRQLNRFKQLHADDLKHVRSIVGAHREQNALTQIETLERVQPLELMSLAAELYESLHPLMEVLTEVTLLTADMRVQLADFLRHREPAKGT